MIPSSLMPLLLTLFGIGLSSFAQLLFLPTVGSYLGASSVGTWAYLFQSLSIASLFEIGATNAIIKMACAIKGKDGYSAFISSSFAYFSMVGVLITMAFIGASYLAPTEIAQCTNYEAAVAVFSFMTIVRWPCMIWKVDLLANQQLAFVAGVEIYQSAGRPLLGTLALTLYPSLISIAIGYSFVELSSVALCRWRSKRQITEPLFARAVFAKIARVGLSYSAVSFAVLTSTYGMSLLVGITLGAKMMAAFSASMLLPFLLQRIGNTIPSTFFPRMAAGILSHHRIMLLAGTTILFAVFSLVITAFLDRLFVEKWMGPEYLLQPSDYWGIGLWLLAVITRHCSYEIARSATDYLWSFSSVLFAEAILVCIAGSYSLAHFGLGPTFVALSIFQAVACVIGFRSFLMHNKPSVV